MQTNGIVFAFEEFSIFDGEGIRTTVFLKGCPLRCQWCHSPEGQSPRPEYLRSPNGCLSCGVCEALADKREGKLLYNARSEAACPRSLIRLCGEELSVTEVVARLMPLLPILNESGGGVTFSGGEALMQPAFLIDCLTQLAGKTDRAIQTCGYATAEIFARVLEQTDTVLYDLKLMDEAAHLHYTGVSNRAILQNYRTLAESGKRIITRIPLIPGVTDTEENLRAICTFLSSLGIDYAELMPYHALAGAKYTLCGREYRPEFDTVMAPNPRAEIFDRYSIRIKIL